MGDIKSAFEIAMKKTERLGKATDEERLEWQYVPAGRKLAARYLKHDCSLVVELKQYEENARKYVIKGAADILIKNINLPRNDATKQSNKRVMDTLKTLKNDKIAVENIYSKIRRIFNHYTEQGEQQKRQAYESLKTELGTKIQQAMQQQLGLFMNMKVDVEKQPQFKEEWRKIQIQLDSQYINLLDEYKKELLVIAQTTGV